MARKIEARRLITLIDTVYDNKVCVLSIYWWGLYGVRRVAFTWGERLVVCLCVHVTEPVWFVEKNATRTNAQSNACGHLSRLRSRTLTPALSHIIYPLLTLTPALSHIIYPRRTLMPVRPLHKHARSLALFPH